MSEIETNTQSQKPKTSKLAIASVICLVAVCLPLVLFSACFVLVSFVCLLASPILGVAALLRIKQSKGSLGGKGIALAGISISPFLIIFGLILPIIASSLPERHRFVCVSNLMGLGKALQIYSNENDGQYPTPDEWCDVLHKHSDVHLKMFKCPGDKKGPCSYALNPNAEPNSPADMVLLFETKGGWNQFGGTELLTTENHSGDGCWILFNDKHAEFEGPKNFRELMWENDQKNK